ncbi:P-loop NTPase fold protein [Paenarthrobacter sp. A20]|uniref:KAP family P-loop NTPase fold protein n=1 Tax=Paenarthrobacter sp. A20 TaxID=2817891 RepID=UPI00209E6D9C|nr:P-loop NTPase fold protein [Paenarthrobacter sp. A20]MCP1413583.1 hypothetical protein [Paenarthrobacter sp. A20]
MPVSDNPISGKSEDLLGRYKLAEELKEFLRVLPAEHGHVLALNGPWGSGKTSFLSLLKESMGTERIVIDFNPWMFQGTNHLVEIFFRELSAQLSLKNDGRFNKIVSSLDNYSSLLVPFSWIPFAGPAFKHFKDLTGATKQLLDKSKGSVLTEKTKLSNALSELDVPVLVFIDDIDRLTSTEVQDLFKLVRLTANFPRVVYVLAYDRFRVEEALSQTGMPGRDYLEKIVQTSFDLPAIPVSVLQQQVADALQQVLDDVGGVSLFDTEKWADVFSEVILPFVRNMRDVRRYASSSHLAVAALKERVELVDILALEAIRVFRPDLMAKLALIRSALTSIRSYQGQDLATQDRTEIESFVAQAKPDTDAAESLIRRLFPAAASHLGSPSYGSSWSGALLRKRVVAHSDILNLYLERSGSTNLTSFERAEVAFSMFKDGNALDAYLRDVPPAEQESVISSLTAFEDDFPAAAVVPASAALLNLYPDLPVRPRQFFDLGAAMVVTRACLRLMKVLESEDERESAAREILKQLKTLSAKWQFLSMIGHWENVGHELVGEEVAAELGAALAKEVSQCPTEDLIGEVELLQLLFLPKRLDRELPPLSNRQGDAFALALLRSARSESLGQSMGSRAVRRTPTLAWNVLIELYGSEVALAEAINGIDTSSLTSDDKELLELAMRYVAGYRPNDWEG